LSGDNVIIRGQPKGGPPPERQLALSNIVAPRLARRAINDSPETYDEVSFNFSFYFYVNILIATGLTLVTRKSFILICE